MMMNEKKSEIEILKPHVALNVQDVERSIEFYRKMFEVEPVKVRKGYAKFDLETPVLNLALNEVPVNVGGGGLSHLGIQVETSDDVTRMRDRWKKSGLLTRDEMQTNCCYALQDKAWVADPDGNEWEVFAVLEDNLETTSACCGTAPELVSASDLTTGF